MVDSGSPSCALSNISLQRVDLGFLGSGRLESSGAGLDGLNGWTIPGLVIALVAGLERTSGLASDRADERSSGGWRLVVTGVCRSVLLSIFFLL